MRCLAGDKVLVSNWKAPLEQVTYSSFGLPIDGSVSFSPRTLRPFEVDRAHSRTRRVVKWRHCNCSICIRRQKKLICLNLAPRTFSPANQADCEPQSDKGLTGAIRRHFRRFVLGLKGIDRGAQCLTVEVSLRPLYYAP